MNVTINTDDVRHIVSGLEGLDADLSSRLDTGMHQATSIYETAVAGFTPVNSGALRGSITTAVTGTLANVHGEVVTDIIYGWPVEEGRKPGKMPPIDAIQLWVKRKLGIGGDESRRVAFVIARAIARRGTKGAFMFKQGFEQATPTVVALFRRIVDEAVAAFGRR